MSAETRPTTAVILEKLVGISDSLHRLECKVDALEVRIHDIEISNASKVTLTDTVNDHEKRIKEVEKLMPGLKVFFWVAGALGLSVIGLIWSLITGTAEIIIK